MAIQAPARERRDNLPAQITSFVGREREVAELVRLLAAERLVTLIGAPGVGKTRLALRVADQIRERFEHGAWLVELAPLAEATLVPAAVARVLGVRERGQRPLIAALAESFRPSELLLIVDNCEHLLDACAALVETVLATIPRLRVLATSREPLGLLGEVVWPVPPLTLPTMDHGPFDRLRAGWTTDETPDAPSSIVDSLLASEAGRLFAERARAVRPTFRVDADNAEAVAEICRRVDGLPLAIELAAARIRALAPAQVAARLEDRFGLLTGGSRAALPRQRTLRALLDWSHALLSEQERRVLRRLAVFAGGWTLDAAESVCAFNEGARGWELGARDETPSSPAPSGDPGAPLYSASPQPPAPSP